MLTEMQEKVISPAITNLHEYSGVNYGVDDSCQKTRYSESHHRISYTKF